MLRKFVVKTAPALLLAGALLGNASLVQADGCRTGGAIGLNEKVILFNVRKDTPCTLKYCRVQWASFRQVVTKKPRGVYGKADAISAAYQPPRGVVGEDYFEVLLRYRRPGGP